LFLTFIIGKLIPCLATPQVRLLFIPIIRSFHSCQSFIPFITADNSIIYAFSGSSEPHRQIPNVTVDTLNSVIKAISKRVPQFSKLEFYSGAYLVHQDDLDDTKPPPRDGDGQIRVLITQGTPHNHITSHHITSHHITSHHITSHHITSHHITSHHITSHHITSHHITHHIPSILECIFSPCSFLPLSLALHYSPQNMRLIFNLQLPLQETTATQVNYPLPPFSPIHPS
jgi:hypothetical protein